MPDINEVYVDSLNQIVNNYNIYQNKIEKIHIY